MNPIEIDQPSLPAVQNDDSLPLPTVERLKVDPSLGDVVKAWLNQPQAEIESLVECFAKTLSEDGETSTHDPVVVLKEPEKGHEFWFIGDVHGDLLGLEAALQVALNRPMPRTIVLLGDLIDDGFYAYEVVLRLFWLRLNHAKSCMLLAGNHDEALRHDGDQPLDARFSTRVDPGDFATWLNHTIAGAQEESEVIEQVGKLFVRLVEHLPRAIFLPGLFASHGGFPHKDLWDDLQSAEDLSRPDCLQDFVWNRLASAKQKLPSRGYSSQSEFGALDCLGFLEKASELLDMPLGTFVRGHDHVLDLDRFSRPEHVTHASYQGRVLTINNMCYTLRREWFREGAGHPRHPTLARWRAGVDELPTPVVLELPDELVNWYTNRCPSCGRPNPLDTDLCTAQIWVEGQSRVCGTALNQPMEG